MPRLTVPESCLSRRPPGREVRSCLVARAEVVVVLVTVSVPNWSESYVMNGARRVADLRTAIDRLMRRASSCNLRDSFDRWDASGTRT
jgi:hypothetical protein